MLAVDVGLRTDQVLTMQLTLTGPRYEEPAPMRRFVDALLPRLRALPGAQAAGAEIFLPLSGSKMGHIFAIEGRPRPEPGQELPADTDEKVQYAGTLTALDPAALLTGEAEDAVVRDVPVTVDRRLEVLESDEDRARVVDSSVVTATDSGIPTGSGRR